MKRSKKLLTIFAVILCLTLIATIFTACNNDEEEEVEPVDQTKSLTVDGAFKYLNKWLPDNFNVENKNNFGIDLDTTFTIDDKTKEDKDSTYHFIAKGVIDLTEGAKANATSIYVELTDITDAEDKKVVFGLAYEVDADGAPYIFGNIKGEKYQKLNAATIQEIVALFADPETGEASAVNMDELKDTLLKALPSILFGTEDDKAQIIKLKDNDFTLPFDVGSILGKIISDENSALLEMVSKVLDDKAPQLNKAIELLCGSLKYDTDKPVTDINTLLLFVKENYSGIKGEITLCFDKEHDFEGAKLTADYTPKGEKKVATTFTLDVNTFKLGTGLTVDVFKDFPMTADERKAEKAHNSLKFNVKGEILGYATPEDDAEATADEIKPNHVYEVLINADLNPFALLDCFERIDGTIWFTGDAEKMADLGYLDFTINEIINEQDRINMLAIHYESDKKRVLVNFDPHDPVTGEGGETVRLALGGTYEIDPLIDYIKGIIANKKAMVTEDEEKGIVIKELLGVALDLSKIKDYEITVNAMDTVQYLLEKLNIPEEISIPDILTFNVENTIKSIFGSDVLTLKINEFNYNVCNVKEEKDVPYTIFRDINNDEHNNINQKTFVNKVNKLSNYKTIYELGEKLQTNEKEIDLYDVEYNTFNNLESTKYNAMVYNNEKPFDTIGKQKLTLDIGIMNDMHNIVGLFNIAKNFVEIDFDILDLPLFGLMRTEIEVEVMPKFDEGKEATLINFTENKNIKVGSDVFTSLKADVEKELLFNIKDEKTEKSYILNNDELLLYYLSIFDGKIDVTKDVLKYGEGNTAKFAKIGNYTLVFNLHGYKIEKEITIIEYQCKIFNGKNMKSL